MLRELTTRQPTNDFARRWLADDYFDLIIWYETDGRIHGFQLCYDKMGQERALTWRCPIGLSHASIDSGEDMPDEIGSPILFGETSFSADRVRKEFIRRSGTLEAEIFELVLSKIDEMDRRDRREGCVFASR